MSAANSTPRISQPTDVGSRPSALLLLGQRLRTQGIWSGSARSFAIHRAQANRTAGGGGEPALIDVYDELAASPFLAEPTLAMDEELAIQDALGAPMSSPNRYESVLDRHAIPTNGIASLLASAANSVRTARRPSNPSDPLVTVGASVAAPVLVGFVAWTLQIARQAGCRHLAFVSRDGQILHAIASRLEARLPPEARLDLAYTHGGRRVWHPAGLTSDAFDGAPPPWWLGEGMPAGYRDTASPLAMLAIQESELPDSVARSIGEISRHAPGRREEILTALWARADVRSALVEVARRRRRLLSRHLIEQGLGQGRWAMVDVGWRGRSAVSLNRALNAEGLTPPLHLYLGLKKPDPELTRTGDWATYLFCRPGPDSVAGEIRGGLASFIEVVCAADHGPARGFREEPGGVMPIMDPVDAAALEWGIGGVQEAILQVVDRVAPFADDIVRADLRPALIELLQTFLLDPAGEEVRAWSSYPFAADPAGAVTAPWVARWSLVDMARWAVTGRRPHSFWPEASHAMSPWPGRALVGARRLAARRVGRRGRR